MVNVRLDNKTHSMTSILGANLDKINACTTKSELYSVVLKIFDENNLNTNASNRLLTNIQRKPNFASALQTIYDSYLCGSKLAVDQK